MNNFDKYNDNFGNEKYLIQTCSQAKMSGTKLLEVHGVQKGLDPNLRPEKQHTIPKQGKSERLQMGQERAGSKRKKSDPINQTINQPSDVTQEIPGRTKIVTGKTNNTHSTNSTSDRLINNNLLCQMFHSSWICFLELLNNKLLNKMPKKLTLILILILIFEENSPFQEGIMSETFQRLDKSFFQKPRRIRRPYK